MSLGCLFLYIVTISPPHNSRVQALWIYTCHQCSCEHSSYLFFMCLPIAWLGGTGIYKDPQTNKTSQLLPQKTLHSTYNYKNMYIVVEKQSSIKK